MGQGMAIFDALRGEVIDYEADATFTGTTDAPSH